MAKLKLRTDYLDNYPELTVTVDEDTNIVSVQYTATHIEPAPPISTEHLAKIVSTILKENRLFRLQGLSPTADGAIICFVQVLPEPI